MADAGAFWENAVESRNRRSVFYANAYANLYHLSIKETPVAVERTYAMLKPGVLQRRIVGEVLTRFERKGLRIVGLKLMKISDELVAKHYAEHVGKAFYEKLVEYTVSGPVIAMVIEGEDAIATVRRLVGPTDAAAALPGTIRGDFAYRTRLNIVHASDSSASAEREIGLFFKAEEIFDWMDGNAEWF